MSNMTKLLRMRHRTLPNSDLFATSITSHSYLKHKKHLEAFKSKFDNCVNFLYIISLYFAG